VDGHAWKIGVLCGYRLIKWAERVACAFCTINLKNVALASVSTNPKTTSWYQGQPLHLNHLTMLNLNMPRGALFNLAQHPSVKSDTLACNTKEWLCTLNSANFCFKYKDEKMYMTYYSCGHSEKGFFLNESTSINDVSPLPTKFFRTDDVCLNCLEFYKESEVLNNTYINKLTMN
jgi:hypothetical protein